MEKFINVDDINEISELFNEVYYGPEETWEDAADLFYDKLNNFGLSKEDKEELIIGIKTLNII